jgi:hypothetical protein
MNVSYAGRRQRRRDPVGDGERERGREIRHHTHWSATEKERTGRNTWYSGRISLCIRLEREAKRGFRLDPIGNPDDLVRSSRKPTHTGVGLTDPALSPVVPIPSFHPNPVAHVNQWTQKGKTLLIQNKQKSH